MVKKSMEKPAESSSETPFIPYKPNPHASPTGDCKPRRGRPPGPSKNIKMKSKGRGEAESQKLYARLKRVEKMSATSKIEELVRLHSAVLKELAKEDGSEPDLDAVAVLQVQIADTWKLINAHLHRPIAAPSNPSIVSSSSGSSNTSTANSNSSQALTTVSAAAPPSTELIQPTAADLQAFFYNGAAAAAAFRSQQENFAAAAAAAAASMGTPMTALQISQQQQTPASLSLPRIAPATPFHTGLNPLAISAAGLHYPLLQQYTGQRHF